MVSAETPSENVHALHPINEWTGGIYFLVMVQVKGFRRFLSTDKPTSKLLRPFFCFLFGLNIQKSIYMFL